MAQTQRTRPRREVRLPFTAEMLSQGEPELLATYRRAAWETYQRLPMPHRKMEAWRRTDIRGLRGETLRLPAPEAYRTLPQPPEALTRPLVDREHGGQMLLLPGGFQRHMQPDLEAQGVIFTDLRTAAAQHPDLLAQVLGKIVPADDGEHHRGFVAGVAEATHNVDGNRDYVVGFEDHFLVAFGSPEN